MSASTERLFQGKAGLWTSLAAVGLILLFLAFAARYAGQQSVWVDESTQLAGLALGYSEQLAWLAGEPRADILVPPDRAPPLSYFIGRAWSGLVGSVSEVSFRWVGVLAVAVGILIVFATMRAMGQTFGSIVAVAFLALSPNVLLTATELRSYPFFFLFSCMVVGAYYLCLRRQSSLLACSVLLLSSLAAAYTHFFGVVVGGAAIAGVGLVQLAQRERAAARTCLAGVIFVVALVGLVPFIRAAVGISGPSEGGGHSGGLIGDAVRLAYRLFAHQSMRMVSGADIIAVLFGGLLVVTSMARPTLGRHWVPIVPLAIGGGAVLGAGLLLSGFSALSSHYNVWMLPFVAVCVGLGAAFVQERLGSWAAVIVVGGSLAASGVAQAALWERGPEYGHTRSRDLQTLVAALGVERTTVLFDKPAGKTFFPMHLWFGHTLDQYALTADGWQDTLTGVTTSTIVPRQCLVIATTKELGARELAAAMWRRQSPSMPIDARLPKPDGSDRSVYPQKLLLAQDALQLSAFCRSSNFPTELHDQSGRSP
jgi:hypothetical protein